ncbi:MAG: biotin/lipoyl-containing protein, partial [bacterium]
MANETVKVPDLGGAESVDVIEISVAVGDSVNPEDPLIVLESDKATMDVPSPSAGTVAKILVKEGDKLSEGDAILELSGESAEPAAEEPANDAPSVKEEEPVPEQQEAAVTSKSAALKEEIVKTVSSEMDIVTPDIGADEAEIIEVAVAEGDVVAEGDAILVLETDKATVEMPAPAAGTVLAIRVAEGGKIKQGDIVGSLQVEGQGSSETASEPDQAPTSAQVPAKSSSPGQPPQAAAEEKPAAANAKEPVQSAEQSAPSAEVYA